MRNASWIEVVWTAICAAAAFLHTFLLGQALKDFTALKSWEKETGTANGKHRAAIRAIRTEAGRIWQAVLFSGIGILAMTLPNRPGGVRAVQWVIAGVFIGAVLESLVNSLLDIRDRAKD